MDRSFIVATAGHVDHGKSALVRALTGIDPDRLPAEKARGITIDLGFAHLRLPEATDDGEPCTIGIVDVPGHEDFVKNMVAGIGSVDLALLVVAADDGWMPQTEEHVQILEYLGVTRSVVALTKIDRLAGTEPAAMTAVRERLRGTAFAAAPIVPISVFDGRGLADLRTELSRALAVLPPPRDAAKPRLWVDRAFPVRGVGTVVTGTLSGGSLETGMEVSVAPRGFVTRIRGLQQHGQAVGFAPPGTRVAIQLADVSVASGESGALAPGVRRGDVITRVELGTATNTCDVWLQRSTRADAGRRLAHGQLLRLHVGTAATAARLVLASGSCLEPGETAPAQLRLQHGLPLFRGDRFVLRDGAGRSTLAGGLVLEPDGDRKRFHRAPTQACLCAQQRAANDAGAVVAALLRRDTALPLEGLLLRSTFAAEEIDAGATAQVQQGEAVTVQRCVVLRSAWSSLLAEARRLIAAHHGAHPAQNGLPLAQLRMRLARGWVRPALFDGLLRALTEQECQQVGAAVKLRAHRPMLPAALDGAVAVVRGILQAHPFDPPSRGELAGTPAQAEALQFLIKTGEAIPLSPEVVMLGAHYDRARVLVGRELGRRGWATVSELRQALGTSRRVIVPLLETLDRAGLTVRERDRRRLRTPGSVQPQLGAAVAGQRPPGGA